jgi:hypothetical protein
MLYSCTDHLGSGTSDWCVIELMSTTHTRGHVAPSTRSQCPVHISRSTLVFAVNVARRPASAGATRRCNRCGRPICAPYDAMAHRAAANLLQRWYVSHKLKSCVTYAPPECIALQRTPIQPHSSPKCRTTFQPNSVATGMSAPVVAVDHHHGQQTSFCSFTEFSS